MASQRNVPAVDKQANAHPYAQFQMKRLLVSLGILFALFFGTWLFVR